MMEHIPIWTATELLETSFPEPEWVVPTLVTSGLTLLVGAPKLGKSWLSLAIAFSVSVGGLVLSKINVPEHDVLYLALEDTPRRLQSRLEKIGATRSERLHIATEWSAGSEGIEWLTAWIGKYPTAKLIIIDTWGRWSTVRDGNDYVEVTRAAAELKRFADDHDVAVVAVHHSKKGQVDDYLDAALGSTGLAAVADTTMVLKRGRGNRDATLSVTGRDVEEAEYVLNFDSNTGTWALQGTAAEIQESSTRQEIYDLLKDKNGMAPKQVADSLGMNHNTVKQLMWKMQKDGILVSLSGVYRVVITVNPVNRKPEDEPKPVIGFTGFTEFTGFTGNHGDAAGRSVCSITDP